MPIEFPTVRRYRLRAVTWALIATLVLGVLIVVGSRNLHHFDAALVGYTFATLFATFGITYRYAMWLQRPPTRMYWRRGWQAFFTPRLLRRQHRRARAPRCVVEFAANRFIFRRGRLRGLAHWLHHVGLRPRRRDHVPAGLRLDPLRDACPATSTRYRTFVFGFPTGDVPDRLAVRVPHLPRPGLGVVPGHRRRDAGDAPAHARPRRGGRAAVRRGHPAADPAVRHQRHRADADGQLHLDEGLRLRLPGDPARGHGDLHAALAAVRQVLPHLPAAGAARRRASTRTRARAASRRACRRCGEPFASRDARRGPDHGRARARLSLRAAGRRREHYQWICPRCRRDAVRPGAGRGSGQRRRTVTTEIGRRMAD